VIYANNALATGIEFTDLSIEVHGDVDPQGLLGIGDVDPRGVLGIGDVDPGFVDDEIRDTTHIESPASREEVRQLVDLAEHHCPAHAALRDSVNLEGDVVVDGEPLD
jgi:uncharacterized OsmC-like protein